jgi:hypothetical protein
VEIPLTQGKVTIIDDGDDALVSGHRWCARRTKCGDGNRVKWYAVSSRGGRTIYMHRLLMGEPASEVDHRDGDGLNNQRTNLRLASRQQNQVNSGPRSGRFKGVRWKANRWQAEIKINYRLIYLGRFVDEEDAARAYDAAAFEAWGEFAYLNFPKG